MNQETRELADEILAMGQGHEMWFLGETPEKDRTLRRADADGLEVWETETGQRLGFCEAFDHATGGAR